MVPQLGTMTPAIDREEAAKGPGLLPHGGRSLLVEIRLTLLDVDRPGADGHEIRERL
jgi:hypothetical protein